MVRKLLALGAAATLLVPLQALSTSAAKGHPPARRTSRARLACPSTDANCELDTEAEPHVAVNPVRPGNVIGVFQMGRYANGGAVDTGWATSFDGGRTWPFHGP